VTQNFDGEIKTLAYPQAALFSFTLALMAYNILATLKAALASVHGVGKIEAALSDFYVVNELQGTYQGMMIAISPHFWLGFASSLSRQGQARTLSQSSSAKEKKEETAAQI
jgi:hypothetical protein